MSELELKLQTHCHCVDFPMVKIVSYLMSNLSISRKARGGRKRKKKETKQTTNTTYSKSSWSYILNKTITLQSKYTDLISVTVQIVDAYSIFFFPVKQD